MDDFAVWVEAERFAGLAREDLDLWRETVGATVDPRDPERGQGRIVAVHWGRTHAAEPARVLLHVQYSSGFSARLSAMQLSRVIQRLQLRPPLGRLFEGPNGEHQCPDEIRNDVHEFRAALRRRQDQAARDRSRRMAEAARSRRQPRDRRRRIALWRPWRRRRRRR